MQHGRPCSPPRESDAGLTVSRPRYTPAQNGRRSATPLYLEDRVPSGHVRCGLCGWLIETHHAWATGDYGPQHTRCEHEPPSPRGTGAFARARGTWKPCSGRNHRAERVSPAPPVAGARGTRVLSQDGAVGCVRRDPSACLPLLASSKAPLGPSTGTRRRGVLGMPRLWGDVHRRHADG